MAGKGRRLFIAVNLPSQVRDEIWHTTEGLRGATFPIRWVRRDGLHLTLKFLGDTSPEVVSSIEDALATVSRGTAPFALELGGFGAFPDPRRPRVLWLACAPSGELEMLQHDVELAMKELGFPGSGRPFRPHITFGRARRGTSPRDFAGMDRQLDELDYHERVEVNSLDLMESQLARDGARYRVVAAVPLGS